MLSPSKPTIIAPAPPPSGPLTYVVNLMVTPQPSGDQVHHVLRGGLRQMIGATMVDNIPFVESSGKNADPAAAKLKADILAAVQAYINAKGL